MQAFGEKAAQIKKAIDAAPAQAAHLRQTVLMTAEQLRSVRDEVELVATGLQAEGDEAIAKVLSELNEHELTIEDAGYEVTGIDMEVSPVQRLIVRMEQFEEVDGARLRSLIAANSSKRTIEAILAAIEKANEISANVALKHLVYRELIVHLGPIPTVRLSWKLVEEPEPVVTGAPVAKVPAAAPLGSSFVQESSFFAPRQAAAPIRVTAPAPVVETAQPVAAHSPAPAPAEHATPSWDRSALDRFKKMPGGSKYSH